jgi:hypothetical protein
MRKVFSVSHLGSWLCLLGSALALVAFFLPYYGSVSGSLWDVLLLPIRQEVAETDIIAKAILALQMLLLLGVAALGCWVVILRTPRQNMILWYLGFTYVAIGCYLIIALFGLVLIQISAEMGSVSPTDLLRLVNIGAWLIPVGLILALWGGLLLRRTQSKAGS